MNSDLLKRILEDDPPVPQEDEHLHNIINRVFNGQRNKAIVKMTLATLFAIVLLVWGMYLLNHVSAQRDMLMGLVLVMCGLELNVLMKLWYWVTDNKITILKEQKKTLLMIAQLNETDRGEAEAREATSSAIYKEPKSSVWERFDPSTLKRISKAVLIAGVLIAILIGIS